ncbi:MAG: hypothetical protein WAW07_15435 [Bacteroidales bacterium]
MKPPSGILTRILQTSDDGKFVFVRMLTGVIFVSLVYGLPVIAGLFTRLAAIPLLTIMITAYFTAKIHVLTDKGFFSFAQVYRVKEAMAAQALQQLKCVTQH